MIDLHCHLLPGLDDGPATVSEALALARAAVAAGTRTMVATPHIDHFHGVAPEEIPVAVAALSVRLGHEGIPLDVRGGGEIALTRLGDLREAELDILRLGGGPYVLLEAPLSMAAGDFDRIFLHEISAGRRRVLLAHPERCPAFQQDPDRLRRLVDAGALVQITAESMTGGFGRLVRTFALDLLREGLVHDVASDAHDTQRRPPDLLRAFAAAERDVPGLSAQVGWLTEEAPAAILSGDELPPRPALAGAGRRRRWFRAPD